MARFWTPGQGYDLEISIDGNDFTRELESCAISYSLSTYYPIIYLDLFVDPDDILLNKLFGQKPIELIIRLLGPNDTNNKPIQLEETKYSLMILNSDFDMPMTESTGKEERQSDRTHIKFMTVPRDSFKVMTKVVNKVYLAENMKNIVNDLIMEAGGTPKIDAANISPEIMDQIICPPKTLIKNLRSLDSIYSIHSGATAIFCDHEKSVYVKNLSDRINQKEAFIIHQLTTSEDEEKVVDEQDEETYITYSPIESQYDANAKLAAISKLNKYIIKPKDVLYYVYTANVSTWAQQYGINDGNGKLYSDAFLDERTKYILNDSAWPYNIRNQFTEASLIKTIANMSKITLTLDRYFNISSLTKVGDPILFKTKTEQYLELTGKYILFSTDIIFSKRKDWTSVASITAIRTNRVKGK